MAPALPALPAASAFLVAPVCLDMCGVPAARSVAFARLLFAVSAPAIASCAPATACLPRAIPGTMSVVSGAPRVVPDASTDPCGAEADAPGAPMPTPDMLTLSATAGVAFKVARPNHTRPAPAANPRVHSTRRTAERAGRCSVGVMRW